MKIGKNYFRAATVLALVLFLALSLVGCGKSTPAKTEQPKQGAQTQKANTAAAPAQKAEIVIKLGHPDTELGILESPYFSYSQVFKSIIETQTGGRIGVQVFPNSQLGDLRSMTEQTVRGDIQITAGISSALLTSYYPNIQVLDIPYTFRTTEIGRKVLTGEFGKELNEELAKKSGLRVISWLPSSFRSFSNNVREIRKPEDLKGLKIRTMQVPVHLAMIKALEANPTPIPFEELYSALQTKVVDGQENAPYTMLMVKLQEVQKYYTLDNHLLNASIVVMNEKFLKSLKPEDQQVVLYAAREAELAMLGVVAAKASGDLDTLTKAGVKIYNPTSAEFNAFRDKVQPFVLKELQGKVDQAWVDKLFKAIKQAEEETSL